MKQVDHFPTVSQACPNLSSAFPNRFRSFSNHLSNFSQTNTFPSHCLNLSQIISQPLPILRFPMFNYVSTIVHWFPTTIEPLAQSADIAVSPGFPLQFPFTSLCPVRSYFRIAPSFPFNVPFISLAFAPSFPMHFPVISSHILPTFSFVSVQFPPPSFISLSFPFVPPEFPRQSPFSTSPHCSAFRFSHMSPAYTLHVRFISLHFPCIAAYFPVRFQKGAQKTGVVQPEGGQEAVQRFRWALETPCFSMFPARGGRRPEAESQGVEPETRPLFFHTGRKTRTIFRGTSS